MSTIGALGSGWKGSALGAQSTATRLLAGRVVGETVIERGAVVLADGRIEYAGPLADLPPHFAGLAVDPALPQGATIVPGLVDTHVHGGGGGEFGSDAQGAEAAIAAHHRHGTTTLFASLVSATDDQLVAATRRLAGLVRDGRLGGIHMEGPFLAASRGGAHDQAALRDADVALVELLAETAREAGAPGAIRQWTFAPDRPGAQQLPEVFARLGIRVAVGHTAADAATTERVLREAAQRAGAPAIVTHIFNAMPPISGREPGAAAGAIRAARAGDAVLEVIADGVHLTADTVRMLFETVGPGAICLVSDAMAAAGLPDGDYRLGALPVVVTQGQARVVGSGAIAGSVAHLADCLRWAVQVAGIGLAAALRSASATPAHTYGLAAGSLAVGAPARLLVLDADLRPAAEPGLP